MKVFGRVWNWMVFKVHSHPSHSVILQLEPPHVHAQDKWKQEQLWLQPRDHSDLGCWWSLNPRPFDLPLLTSSPLPHERCPEQARGSNTTQGRAPASFQALRLEKWKGFKADDRVVKRWSFGLSGLVFLSRVGFNPPQTTLVTQKSQEACVSLRDSAVFFLIKILLLSW